MDGFMDGDGPLWPWWASMVVISCCNFLFFRHARLRSRPSHTPQDRRYLRYLRNLCVPFLFECAWRSVFPSLYNERQVLFDTPLNSILLDRSLAAIGEICWVLQICLILEQLATDLRQHWMKGCCGKCFVELCSMIMALLAFVGEFFSFVGTFTTNVYFEVLEAICWCSLFGLASLASLTLLVRTHMAGACGVAAKRFMVVLTLQGFFYCPYMILYNIPMYWRIFRHDEEEGKTYLSILEGIVDSWRTRERCQEWRCWRDDWFWMSFYFSFAVWSSICMMYAPRLRFARLTSQAGAL